jgi:hypothetical protein
MFDFSRRRTAKELMDEAKEKYILPEETKIKPKEPQEYFRVGYIEETGMTTLTFLAPNGYSSTLSMNQQACEQMIRMLRATYHQEQPTEGDEDA